MRRRHFLPLLSVGVLLPLKAGMACAASSSSSSRGQLLTAPVEVGGNWGGSAPTDVAAVVGCMRAACLTGVTLLSDRQPEKLRVDAGSGSNPSVRLHAGAQTTAWVAVIVGSRDWCNLAYQFGHELGHVFCNSWEADARPRNPSQWLEEALVEAFSLRGLALLADRWARSPPFTNDGAYAGSIQSYRETILTRYRAAAQEQGAGIGFGAWFKAREVFFHRHGGVDAARGAVSTMLGLLESDAAMVTDMGALNRWPERSGIPVFDYLSHWEKSCEELKAPGRLPGRIRELLTST